MFHPAIGTPQIVSLILFAILAGMVLVFATLQLRQLFGYRKRVDPWQLQGELMRISDQERPTTPRITNGSLMYAALQAEELAEQYQALVAQLRRNYDDPSDTSTLIRANPTLAGLIVDMGILASMMEETSVSMRKRLPLLLVDVPLVAAHAKDIFDGVTDSVVVAAGFALASGFPGAAGYRDVQLSNLSKQNPETGIIDKTADGKWIKGTSYVPPDLHKVLVDHGAYDSKDFGEEDRQQ